MNVTAIVPYYPHLCWRWLRDLGVWGSSCSSATCTSSFYSRWFLRRSQAGLTHPVKWWPGSKTHTALENSRRWKTRTFQRQILCFGGTMMKLMLLPRLLCRWFKLALFANIVVVTVQRTQVTPGLLSICLLWRFVVLFWSKCSSQKNNWRFDCEQTWKFNIGAGSPPALFTGNSGARAHSANSTSCFWLFFFCWEKHSSHCTELLMKRYL